MSGTRPSSRDVLGLVGLAIAATLASWAVVGGAEERPKASSVVKVQAQGGGGVEPELGAPPAVAPSLESRPVPGTLGVPPSLSRTGAALTSLRALSMAEGEASVEVDGVRETVRTGSRLGRDTVKAVSPGRLVLERQATANQPSALVIVTFDEAGRGKERVFWTADPTVKASAQATIRNSAWRQRATTRYAIHATSATIAAAATAPKSSPGARSRGARSVIGKRDATGRLRRTHRGAESDNHQGGSRPLGVRTLTHGTKVPAQTAGGKPHPPPLPQD